jgi:hypothetical protein
MEVFAHASVFQDDEGNAFCCDRALRLAQPSAGMITHDLLPPPRRPNRSNILVGQTSDSPENREINANGPAEVAKGSCSAASYRRGRDLVEKVRDVVRRFHCSKESPVSWRKWRVRTAPAHSFDRDAIAVEKLADPLPSKSIRIVATHSTLARAGRCIDEIDAGFGLRLQALLHLRAEVNAIGDLTCG